MPTLPIVSLPVGTCLLWKLARITLDTSTLMCRLVCFSSSVPSCFRSSCTPRQIRAVVLATDCAVAVCSLRIHVVASGVCLVSMSVPPRRIDPGRGCTCRHAQPWPGFGLGQHNTCIRGLGAGVLLPWSWRQCCCNGKFMQNHDSKFVDQAALGQEYDTPQSNKDFC